MENSKLIKFDTKRSFGIEIEVGKEIPKHVIFDAVQKLSHRSVRSSYYHPSINNNFWDIKHDGSCGAKIKNGTNEGGYEITSFKGSGVKDLLHISKVVSGLKSTKIKTNHNCGMHVHVDVSDFSTEDIGVFINNWLCIENLVFSMVPSRRRFNKFCNKISLSKPENLNLKCPNDYWNYYKPNSTALTSSDRRMAINLLNFFRSIKLKTFNRKTVEFRFPESTLVEKNIKNWTRFFVFFIESVKTRNRLLTIDSANNCCDLLYVAGLYPNKENTLLSEGLQETRLWILKRICRYGESSCIKNQAKNLIEKFNKKGN
jgi:hypothetical protein